MARRLLLLAGILAYLIFFATFLYLVGFVANLPGLPHTVDVGPATPTLAALSVDLALIALFGLQHSLMARQGFKRAITRLIPQAIERSVYVLAASLVLIVLFLVWQPIPTPLWSVAGPAAILLWSLAALGWLTVLFTTFLLNHFELFGLQQVYRNLRRIPESAPVFRQPLLYKLVRHPLYSGFILAFWATPHMSFGHLILAMGMTAYILIALKFEERDLVATFGAQYTRYQQTVGMLTPRRRR